MQVVTRVELGAHPVRRRRIPQRHVEVDHRVERPAPAHEVVDRHPHRVQLAGEVLRAAEGNQRSADHQQTPRPDPRRDLTQRRHHRRRLTMPGLAADVVDAQQDHHRAHPRHGQHVPLQPGTRVRIDHPGEQPVGTDARVHHPQRRPRPCRQPPRQLIRPAAVGARRGTVALGDRVAERHHRAARPTGDVHPAHVRPPRDRLGEHPTRLHLGVITGRRHVRGLVRVLVEGDRTPPGGEHTDQQVPVGRHRQRHRVAAHLTTGRDHHRPLPTEGQHPQRTRHRGRRRSGHRDRHRVQPHRRDAKGVGQPNPHRPATHTGAHHGPHRPATVAGHRSRRRTRPRADPPRRPDHGPSLDGDHRDRVDPPRPTGVNGR